jgi:hypothetical protein
MTTPEAPIGAKVQVSAGIGHVRWSGFNPAFAAGKWVGVELCVRGLSMQSASKLNEQTRRYRKERRVGQGRAIL